MQPLIVAQQVTQGVADFLRTAFPSTTPGFIGLLERFLEQRYNIFKGPYLTVPLPFSPGPRQSKPAFPWLPEDFKPHAHQAKAFQRLGGEGARSTLVATGTGSGKTECFLYPILEHCRQARAEGRPGIKAVILYPMNALASDQAGRVAKTIVKTAALAGVRAGLYVGETPAEESTSVRQVDAETFTVITDRDALRANPPDILLTNYKMLDFLLLRAADGPLWAHQRPDTLRYLVVDELHTFDGAQGTDLACLIRRLKGRLGAAPGQLVCVGTSATLGDGGGDSLLNFARDIFGEAMDADAVIGEDRVAVGDYLSDAVVEHTMSPQPSEEGRLDPANHPNLLAYLSEQAGLWFGDTVPVDRVEDFDWRCDLGQKLKSHFAFQNLLRDLDRLGPKSVPVDDLLALLRRRLPKRQTESADGAASDRFVLLWLSSLLALVAHARKPGHQDFFLQVKVEIWQRELRRMVAKVDAQPVLRHHDDLGMADKDHQHLPVIHCRDCHATGWGATLPKTSPNQLQQDLRLFYSAFFSEDVSTRFLFPATQTADRRVFERKQVCPRCGSLHQMTQRGCSHCGHETLLAVDITANLKQGTRNGAPFTKSHHNCPYCGGHNTLTIVGSQAASLVAVMVGQLFSSGYNQDKKLIAFSDSVQDAAHRAGFLGARTWRLNLRPALAQTIAAAAASGEPLTLAQLPKAFEAQWRTALGESHYVANFLPPQLHWMRDMDTLMATGELPDGSQVPVQMAQVMPWVINAEFGQDAHVGRTLVATGTACVAPVEDAWARAIEWLQLRLREQVEALKDVTPAEISVFLRGLVGEMQRIGAWRDPMLAFYARVGCRPQAYKKNPSQEKMLSGPRPPRFLTLPEYQLCTSIERDESRGFTDWALKALQELNLVALGAEQVVRDVYRLALEGLAAAGLAANEQGLDKPEIQVWGLEPAAFKVELGGRKWRCATCHNEVLSGLSEDFDDQPCRRTGCKGSIEGKATLNVLTDEGLLPNYAFPEQGVLLRSIIVREAKPGGGAPDPLTFEYERPSASAITELAPNNTFYAEGRRVVVNQVDVSKIKPEAWRFCRQCSYTEPLSSGDHHANCPRCGDTMWRDSGRVREMLKLTTVFARTLDRESRIADDSDERQRGFYVRQALVDSPPDAVRDAYVIDKPEFPFGFEFLDKVTFREVNFGEQAPDASPMTIAGAEMNRPGFNICPECGTIQRRRKAEEMYRNHAPYCSKRKDPEATAQQCVFLYREFASEGIRLFLPEVGFGDTEERLLSFVSALELGLTRRFRGAVDHLRIALDIRMAAGQEIPRCYLVIYDSVPGGTGYLKELMRAPEPLLEVLELALQALNECVCNQDAEADGCYRCVYAYRNSYDRESISRRIAQKLLGEVVQHKTSLKQVANLSGVQTGNQLFDSTLEKRFVEALRREHGGKRYSLTEVLFKGKPGYQLQAEARRWRVELQVNLAEGDSVVVACKPDFVFWPDDGVDDLPIAVFLDGWQFHKDSISTDLAKRMAVAKSGKFSVWTLTWDDIETVLQGKDSVTPSPWPTLLIEGGGNVVPKMCEALGLPAAMNGFKSLAPFIQLHQRLSDWRFEDMRRLGVALAIGQVMPPGDAAVLTTMRQGAYWHRLEELALLPDHNKHRLGGRQLGSVVRLAVGSHPDHLGVLMKGAGTAQHEPMLVAEWVPDSVPEAERQARWQQLWQCLNLLLPLRHLWAGAAEMPGLEALQNAPVLQQQTSGLPAAWMDVLSLVLRETQAWAHALALANVPVPEVGYELLDEKGRIVAESEMAWPVARVTVLMPDSGDAANFEAAGWTSFVVTEGPLPPALKDKLTEASA